MIQRRRNEGFTLVELMLSMAFIGVLLLAIAVTSTHIMATYTKGLTVREVNQVGRTISEDIQRTIATSVPFNVVPKTGQPTDPIDSRYVVNSAPDGEIYGGRLCTGTHSYVWNYGKVQELADPGGTGREPAPNRYIDGYDGVIRLVKVSDAGGVLCANMNQAIDPAQSKELLLAGDRNLAVQELTVRSDSRDEASGQALYAITLVLGTNDQEQVNAADATCRPPNEGSGFEEYCAINQFNIIARAGNRSGSLQ